MDGFLAKQRFLVIAPHADDETFGCAGTIARIKDLGGQVYVIVVSVGDLAHYGVAGKVSGETRIAEFEAVMEFLGVDDYDVIFKEKEKHLRLDAMPRRDLIALLESDSKLAIDKVKPTMIAIPAISYNQDHEAVFRAGFTACRPHLPEVKPFQKLFLAYDNPAISWSTEREKFHPNFYVDISNYLDKKLQAVLLHKSQFKASPHHASVESVDYLAKVRGREVSVLAAEAYMCYRCLL